MVQPGGGGSGVDNTSASVNGRRGEHEGRPATSGTEAAGEGRSSRQPSLTSSPEPKKSRQTSRPGVQMSKDVLIAKLPLPQDLMGSSRQAKSSLLSSAETAAMVNTFRSGVRHAGWLHKLVGKTPQDIHWRKYWCYLQDDRLYYQPDPEHPTARTRYIAIDRVPVRPLPHRRRWADATMMTSPDIGASMVDTGMMAHLKVKLEPDTVFGLVSGSHSIFFAAETPDEAHAWVRAIHEAWVHCFKHTLRGTENTKGQVHENARLMAANEALRKSLVEAQDTSALEEAERQTWKQWLEEKARNRMLEQQLTGNAMYEVEVKTGGMKGASTDARVSIEMLGPYDGDSTGDLRLINTDSHHRCFGRNALDMFLVTAKDIGLPRVIKIWHDNTGRHPDWFLDYVRIRKRLDPAPPGPPVTRCSPRSPHFHGKRSRPPSIPSAAAGTRKFNSRGRGGRGAMMGGKASRTSSAVRASADFSRPATRNAVSAHAPVRSSMDVGSLMLQRSKDLMHGGAAMHPASAAGVRASGGAIAEEGGAGMGLEAQGVVGGVGGEAEDSRDWALEGVWGPWVVFPCHRWLSTEVDDCRISRTLFVGHQSPLHTYKVLTHTSDIRGAATDANVYLIMHGTLGDSKRHVLTSGPDDFSRGTTNNFEIDDEELGELLEITIGHDNTSSNPSWHMDHAVILNTKTDQKFVFMCRQWFDSRIGDGRIERTLPASAEAGEMVPYTFKVTTADVRGASTDADVYVALHGNKGSTPTTVLPSQPENFERGETDTFRLILPDVGEVQSLTIGHNNQGPGPEWLLEFVEVSTDEVRGKGRTYFFPCHKWFGLNADAEGLLERTLMPSKEDPRKNMTEYKVEFYTSAERGAGTDANVSFQLIGDKGQSVMQRVPASREAFERGTSDKFTFRGMRYLGKLSRMVVQHDNSGPSPAWHLFKAVVTCAKDNSTTTFICNRWIESQSPSSPARVELTAGGTEPEITSFHVEIYTSTCKGAGTDGNVTIKINGSEGTLGPYHLDNPNSFGRGSKDCFVLDRVLDVGMLESIEVALDGSGTRPFWHLNRILISKGGPPDIDGENAVFFPCGSWFGKDTGLKKLLKPARMTPEEGEVPYLLRLQTADAKGAGTDSTISARIVGSKAESDWRPLLANHDTFERGQEDVFKLLLPELGSLRSLALRTDCTSENPSWCLDWAILEPEKREWKGEKSSAQPAGPPTFFVAGPEGWIGPPPLKTELTMTAVNKDPRGDRVEFTVWVHTSDVKYAGTDADLLLEIVGDVCTSSRKPLTDPTGQRDLFERGQVDQFQIQCRDVGRIKSIILEMNTVASKPNWHLDKVVIEGPDKRPIFFPYANWLGPASQTKVEIPAQFKDPTADRCVYEVTTHTSDVQNAGTDANVYVDIRGIMGSTGKVMLRNESADCFERGQSDTFKVRAPMDLGPLVELVVGHDQAGGLMDAWHLEQVDVKKDSSEKAVYFECNRWLDTKHNLEVILEPSDTDPRAARRTYTVMTRTGTVPNASTDANVYVDIKGMLDSSGKQWLRNASAETFQNGQTDEFKVVCKNLGPLSELVIGHDNLGVSPNWFLELVTVKDEATQTTYWFLCDQWFSTTQGDGRIERVLRASTQPVDVRRNAPYQIIVKTSDVSGASTDANVHLIMYSAKGKDTGPLKLEDKTKRCFQRGQEDRFELVALDVDPIRKIRIGHDNSGGPNAPWHLEFVEVVNKTTGSRTRFNANCWLSAIHDDYQVERDLYPAGTQPDDNKYAIEVFTSNLPGAGTDCDVFCKLFGQMGETGDLRLDNPKDNMEPGQRDSFLIRAEDVGMLHTVRIWHDNAGPKPNWHMDYMTIVASVRPSVKYWCYCNDWLDEDNGLVKELKAFTYDPRSSLTTYRVVVHTSDCDGAGTTAKVSMIMMGAEGDSGPRRLRGTGRLFQEGSVDAFSFTMVDLGELEKLLVWHDNSGPNPSWNLDYIEVHASPSNKVWYFPCGRWFDALQGDSLIKRQLTATREDPKTTRALYRVTVITADEPGAGTQANVYVNIYGAGGETGQVFLVDPSKNNFERGQTDVFKFNARNVSPITQLLIGHDGKGPGAGWKLDRVIVENVASGERLTFIANRWLDSEMGDGALEVKLVPAREIVGGTKWRLNVTTGDLPEAGTDADVTAEVIGNKDRHVEQLHAMRGAFEAGRTDSFVFTSHDLGRVEFLTMSHNDKGESSNWYLEHATLENLATGEEYFFLFQCWLDSRNGLRQKRPVRFYRRPGMRGPCDYKVELTTAPSEDGSLPSGTVFMDIQGSLCATGRQNLVTPPGGYLAGRTVTQLLPKLPDTGTISDLEVGHTGPRHWLIKEVRITNLSTGISATFAADRPMLPNVPMSLKPVVDLPLCDYELLVATSDVRDAGTTARVFFDLTGAKGSTGGVPLPASSTSASDTAPTPDQGPAMCSGITVCCPSGTDTLLARGSQVPFVVKDLPDVGTMQSLKIGHDNSGPSPSWHLAWVRVRNLRTGASARFPCGQWLASDAPDQQTARNLAATDVVDPAQQQLQVRDTKADQQMREVQERAQREYERQVHELMQQQAAQQLSTYGKPLSVRPGTTGPPGYKITFNTSGICFSGTSAPVFFELVGFNGSSGTVLVRSLQTQFSRGSSDSFLYPRLPYLGPLQQMRVGTTGEGMASTWHLRNVLVTALGTSESWMFECHEWIDKPSNWQRVLQARKLPGQ